MARIRSRQRHGSQTLFLVLVVALVWLASPAFAGLVAECGDGVLEGPELCDDGNTDSGDGCDLNCIVEPGFSCPQGGTPCIANCGDGLVVGSEECDEGDTDDNDGCSSTCMLEICGDGIIQLIEVCDDGNGDSGDGCDANCALEPGFSCPQAGSLCLADCGDGLVVGTEECDEGDTDDNDGCSSTCLLEICGDGILQVIETCDDGNGDSGDGCSSTCETEPGAICRDPGQPCVIVATAAPALSRAGLASVTLLFLLVASRHLYAGSRRQLARVRSDRRR